MHRLFTHSALVAVLGAVGFGSVSAFRSWESGVQRELRRSGVELSERSLTQALERGDRELARKLLEAGVPPVGRDVSGRTPLMLALAIRDPGLAREMIESGASVTATDAAGESVLGHAVRAGEVSVVKKLLDRGVDPETVAPGGGNLMVHATEDGRIASAKLMLDAGAGRGARGADGTPLAFHAVRRGLHWMLRELLESGCRVGARDAAGDTLLHAAVRSGDAKAAELLWKHGAEPDWTDREGRTALHLATAANQGDFVADLVARGASVDRADPGGLSPLHHAVRNGSYDTLRVLLGAKADVSRVDPAGRTALDLALNERDFEAAQVLFDYGAKAGDRLYAAVKAGDGETFDFLLRNGVDPNPARDDSPLVAAVRGGENRMVAALLDAGARLGGPGLEGQKALHLAMARDEDAMVRELLEHGADADEAFGEAPDSAFMEQVRSEGYIKWHLRNDKRVTPLMMAADRGDIEMARVLLEHGAKTGTYTTRHRYWPIGFAARRSDIGMMKLLLKRDPDRDERWVKVDLSAQRAWVYNEGGRTIYTTKVSSGKKGFRTKTGEFVITNKTRDHESNLYEGAKMPYFQRLSCGDFGFHEGYVPGYPASHGCLRVPAGAARKLWSITRVGDKVVIVP